MKEDVFENPVELRAAVPSPHFEDRRVAWRAQRVVPLDEIHKEIRRRRLWFLSGAFAVAMLLGAASALLAVYIKQVGSGGEVTQATPAAEPEAIAPQMETAALQEPEELETETSADAPLFEDETESMKPVVTPKRPPNVAQRPRIVARDDERLRPRPGEVEPSETEQLEQIREAVLYDQWQERRMRRAGRRERRNRGDRNLSHVDELFEGPRRPDRRP